MQTAKLTAKQARWVQEYLACGNASASAVKAGFSPRGAGVAGNRMLKNANVQKALQARQAADCIRLSIERNDVIVGLLWAVEQAREQCNPAVMVRGLAEIGRMMGYYAHETKRTEVSPLGRTQIQRLNQMSDAELVGLIEIGETG